jgi:hypothetical protein
VVFKKVAPFSKKQHFVKVAQGSDENIAPLVSH